MDDHFSLALWTGWMLNGNKFLFFWPKLHKWHFHTIVVALTSIYAEMVSEMYSLNNIFPVSDDIDYLGKVLVRADCTPAYFDEYLRMKRYNHTSNHADIKCMISKLFTTTNGTISNRALGSYYFTFYCGAVSLLAGLFLQWICIFISLLCYNRLEKKKSPQKAKMLQIQSPIANYKPVSKHPYHVKNLSTIGINSNIWTSWSENNAKKVSWFCLLVFLLQREDKRKVGAQYTSMDKKLVMDLLFSAFEKNQYCNIKQLVDVTKQPVVRAQGPISPKWETSLSILSSQLSPFISLQVYLKSILREIGVYNVTGTHKYTWELRPEYRLRWRE